MWKNCGLLKVFLENYVATVNGYCLVTCELINNCIIIFNIFSTWNSNKAVNGMLDDLE